MTPAWVEVLLRLAQFGCGLAVFGVPAFAVYRRRAWVATGRSGSPLRAILIVAAVGLLLAGSAATFALALNMYGSIADAFQVEALWSVLTGLQVGAALGVRLVLTSVFLPVLLIMPQRTAQQHALVILGGLIVASFAWSGHGAATEGAWALLHLVADIFHLLAAAVWIGALVALTHTLARAATPKPATVVNAALAGDDLKAFSTLGSGAVGVIVVTGLINSAVLIGVDRIGQMTIDPYGQILLAKIAVFGAMLALAAANRFIWVPHLERQRLAPEAALSSLKISVSIETLLGLLVLLAVSIMGRIAPLAAG